MDGEEWRDMRNGARISSHGRMQNTQGVVFTPKPRADGYVVVIIRSVNYLVHRLVAEHFNLHRTPEQVEVNHKDGNPSNNHVSNLEYASTQENVKHSYETNKTRGNNVRRTVKPIRGRKLGTSDWTVYKGGASEAARVLCINAGNVTAACHKSIATAYGYEFEYDEPVEPDVLPGEEWREIV